MRIVRARQISQVFFCLLFLWFCVVATVGEAWWQLRGWPVNLFLQLDPLVALATILATRTLYAGLLWALVTVVLTLIVGRFFCSWVCPFGALHHLVGFLAGRGKTAAALKARNRYRSAQVIKYALLVFFLAASAGDLLGQAPGLASGPGRSAGLLLIVGLLIVAFVALAEMASVKRFAAVAFLAGCWAVVGWFLSGHELVGASVQTGLLDPIPFLYRSVNLTVVPVVDGTVGGLAVGQRFTAGGWFIGFLFFAALSANLWIPRFYCRFVCPLGALFAVLGKHALWRIGKKEDPPCTACAVCEAHCEGACEPSQQIRIRECVLCMNCLEGCPEGTIGFQTDRSFGGEMDATGLSRRGFVLSLFSGVAVVPLARIGGALGPNWSPHVVRPPGALAEPDFLARCIKCGQCMRACPTNVIQPAGMEAGLEGLWSPVLNFRIGTSGCQYNCIACGHVCPTAAIRPLTLDEKQGKNAYEAAGPIRLGTAFVDRGRCLPWAMNRPCIVCQENCPVSPKAILTEDVFVSVRQDLVVRRAAGLALEVDGPGLEPGSVATGDYYVLLQKSGGGWRRKIAGNEEKALLLTEPWPPQVVPAAGDAVEVQILLKRPSVAVDRCIGCGVCEHECPVRGQRAIRVTGENESRNKAHVLIPGGVQTGA